MIGIQDFLLTQSIQRGKIQKGAKAPCLLYILFFATASRTQIANPRQRVLK